MLLVILAFLTAHGAELAAVAYALLNLANALASGPEARGVLGRLADLLAVLTRKDAPGTLKMPGRMSGAAAAPRPPINLLPLALAALTGLSACAHVPPDLAAFGAKFGACMEARGLQAAPGVGADVWKILSGGGSVSGMAGALEGLLPALGGRAIEDAATCAVEAWLASPAPARSPNGVAAARVFLARRALAGTKR